MILDFFEGGMKKVDKNIGKKGNSRKTHNLMKVMKYYHFNKNCEFIEHWPSLNYLRENR